MSAGNQQDRRHSERVTQVFHVLALDFHLKYDVSQCHCTTNAHHWFPYIGSKWGRRDPNTFGDGTWSRRWFFSDFQHLHTDCERTMPQMHWQPIVPCLSHRGSRPATRNHGIRSRSASVVCDPTRFYQKYTKIADGNAWYSVPSPSLHSIPLVICFPSMVHAGNIRIPRE